MGVTKTENFTEDQNTIATYAKVLAHPARIAILKIIAQSNSCICGDLVNEIGLAQATISQHLKELKTIGLLNGTVDGTSVCYCINQEKWDEFQEVFRQFFNQAIAQEENHKQNCC
jgi:DNA-binding transcriptional ArsR family regulator